MLLQITILHLIQLLQSVSDDFISCVRLSELLISRENSCLNLNYFYDDNARYSFKTI